MPQAIGTRREIPLLDLRALHLPMRDEIVAEIVRVVDSQRFIMGEDVSHLEKSIADYCRTAYAIGCASGSDALFLALLALDVTTGDEVITTPFSFFATAGAISRAGATPVFVDIDSRTFNLDARLLADAVSGHSRAKAIIPVHLFGGCADMDPILEIARENGLPVIEDGAQSIGAEYNGRSAMSLGDIGCISFFPSKNLGAFGDGGMLTTNDEPLARKLASLHLHGTTGKYHHEWIGINSRLDSLQAAVLRVKLRSLDNETAGRQRNAQLYRAILGAKSTPAVLPQAAEYQTRHVYNQFVLRAPRRDQLKSFLQQNGVGTEIYYPRPLHLQPCYRHLNLPEGAFPVSEQASRDVLALPIHSALSPEDIEYICDLIVQFYS